MVGMVVLEDATETTRNQLHFKMKLREFWGHNIHADKTCSLQIYKNQLEIITKTSEKVKCVLKPVRIVQRLCKIHIKFWDMKIFEQIERSIIFLARFKCS